MSSTNEPASVGSSARRRGRDAVCQRHTSTDTVATQAPIRTARWVWSSAWAMPASGNASSRLFSMSSSNSIHTKPRISSGRTNRNTSSLSTLVSSRPAVSSVTSSATKRTLQRSTSSTASVSPSGVASSPSSVGRKNAKPVAVISAPLRLSGRRCQATMPQAANEPPTQANTTSSPWTGSSRANSAGRSASNSATTAAVHSAAQKAIRRSRALKRRSSVTSPATVSHGARISILLPTLFLLAGGAPGQGP